MRAQNDLMKNSTITTAARRIAREHNRNLRAFAGNGKLVFSADGTGGSWCSDGSHSFGPGKIVVWMRNGRITPAEAQDIIDHA